jgi:hypothetical protein
MRTYGEVEVYTGLSKAAPGASTPALLLKTPIPLIKRYCPLECKAACFGESLEEHIASIFRVKE